VRSFHIVVFSRYSNVNREYYRLMWVTWPCSLARFITDQQSLRRSFASLRASYWWHSAFASWLLLFQARAYFCSRWNRASSCHIRVSSCNPRTTRWCSRSLGPEWKQALCSSAWTPWTPLGDPCKAPRFWFLSSSFWCWHISQPWICLVVLAKGGNLSRNRGWHDRLSPSHLFGITHSQYEYWHWHIWQCLWDSYHLWMEYARHQNSCSI